MSQPKNESLIESLFPSCRGSGLVIWTCSKLYIENSVFEGSLGDDGGVIQCEDMHLELVNCYFSLTADADFIYHRCDFGSFTATNTTFNASDVQSNDLVTIMDLLSMLQIFKNTQIMCPKSFDVLSIDQQIIRFNIQSQYVCQKACTGDEYTYQAGSTILSGTSDYIEFAVFSDAKGFKAPFSAYNPNCSSCPIGANCTNHIKALPNYWGYKDKHDIVNMIRCPNGYCCQEKETCKGIDSCNVNRTGPLCGKCEANFTEALFSAKCFLVDDCPAALILVLYVIRCHNIWVRIDGN